MRLQIGSIDIPESASYWLRVFCSVDQNSIRAYVARAIENDITRNQQLYTDLIAVKASELGISWEQCYMLFLNFTQPFSTEDIEAAKLLTPVIRREYGQNPSTEPN